MLSSDIASLGQLGGTVNAYAVLSARYVDMSLRRLALRYSVSVNWQPDRSARLGVALLTDFIHRSSGASILSGMTAFSGGLILTVELLGASQHCAACR